jgi:hypothetical protein
MIEGQRRAWRFIRRLRTPYGDGVDYYAFRAWWQDRNGRFHARVMQIPVESFWTAAAVGEPE